MGWSFSTAATSRATTSHSVSTKNVTWRLSGESATTVVWNPHVPASMSAWAFMMVSLSSGGVHEPPRSFWDLAGRDHGLLDRLPHVMVAVDLSQLIERREADGAALAEVSAGHAADHAVVSARHDGLAVDPVEHILAAVQAEAARHALLGVDRRTPIDLLAGHAGEPRHEDSFSLGGLLSYLCGRIDTAAVGALPAHALDLEGGMMDAERRGKSSLDLIDDTGGARELPVGELHVRREHSIARGDGPDVHIVHAGDAVHAEHGSLDIGEIEADGHALEQDPAGLDDHLDRPAGDPDGDGDREDGVHPIEVREPDEQPADEDRARGGRIARQMQEGAARVDAPLALQEPSRERVALSL